jgi:hypothetical protein
MRHNPRAARIAMKSESGWEVVRRGLSLVIVAVLCACTAHHDTAADSLITQHRRAIAHPRPIDRAVNQAAAEAVAKCGGAVRLNVEADPAAYGWDPSHYECAPR